MLKKISEFIVTLFYCGFSPVAPGTVGSAVSLIFVLPLIWVHSILLCLLAFGVSIALGVIFIPLYLNGRSEDLQEIVIDEMAGLYTVILITMLWVKALSIIPNWYIILALCFIFFRFFDIKKPYFIGHLDRTIKGTAGVIIDDIAAGVAGGGAMCIVLTIYKIFFV